MNVAALVMFLIFIAATLVITRWAARRAGSRNQFYAAGGQITGFQNGFAFAGDLLSASVFLGVAGLYFTSGYDGFAYCIGALISFPLLTFLLSDRLRAIGKYTFTDVLAWRLKHPAVRVFAVFATIAASTFYMVGQLVGAGVLMRVLLGIDFVWSVTFIGAIMITYVIFGGMVATTWVQIIKASILIATGIVMAVWVVILFGGSFEGLITAAIAKHPLGESILIPTTLITSPAAGISFGLTLALGPAGLPHILMRFFTVPNVKEARKSAAWATFLIGGFYLLMIPIGYGTIAILGDNPAYISKPGALQGGSNMASLYLAQALGGDLFLGFAAAVAFATILAVVAGLTMASAATISHDLFATVIRKGKQTEAEEIRVSRIAAFAFGALTIVLSIIFQHENITLLVVLGVAIAASATFPLLLLALFWRPLTAAGAVWGGSVGLVTAVVGIFLGPSVWVAVLGHQTAIFPYQYPTIVSLPLAVVTAVVVSLLTKEKAAFAPAE